MGDPAYPGWIVWLARDELSAALSFIFSFFSLVVSGWVAYRLLQINRQFRFWSRKEDWLSQIKSVNDCLVGLLLDEISNASEIRAELIKARATLDSVRGTLPVLSRDRRKVTQTIKKIETYLDQDDPPYKARRVYERLIETNQWLEEQIVSAGIFKVRA